jgi:predicted RNase H-like HicB family nuclease
MGSVRAGDLETPNSEFEKPCYHPSDKGEAMRYRIALHKSDEGYSVSVPGLPGCWSQGSTEAEAIDNIKDAIREYLAVVEDQLRNTDTREVEVAI